MSVSSQDSPLIPLLYLLGWGLTWSSIVYFSLQQIHGKKVSIMESLNKGIRKLIFVGITFFLFLVFTFLGLMALIIPGIVIWCGLYLSIPVVILEDLGPFASFSRSWKLTYGFKRSILNAVILLGLAAGAFFILLFLLGGVILALFHGGPLGIAIFVVLYLFGVFTSTILQTIAPAVMYHKIREEKEGINLEALIKKFD
ncbi:MAG: hypothetical protein D6785_10490 [Planctomycetota bacterium]|nr:MAG: hypothetical protein D6785_10490 [Planctomycetota bacterium]